ncbi:MAG: hypothetical protein SWY16_11755 [Cyanobacteriota bacterium]|nr:hypothetical protein [Cyanobacteriota bacterium]
MFLQPTPPPLSRYVARHVASAAIVRTLDAMQDGLHAAKLSMLSIEIGDRTCRPIESVVRIVTRAVKAVRWKKLFVLLAAWSISEFTLNCVGLDDLADYSEFVFERNRVCLTRYDLNMSI